MNSSFKDWIGQGEQLYNALLEEFQRFQKQIDELEQQLVSKKAEVNQLAEVIGRPGVDRSSRPAAEAVESNSPLRPTTSSASIARAINGDVAVKLL